MKPKPKNVADSLPMAKMQRTFHLAWALLAIAFMVYYGEHWVSVAKMGSATSPMPEKGVFILYNHGAQTVVSESTWKEVARKDVLVWWLFKWLFAAGVVFTIESQIYDRNRAYFNSKGIRLALLIVGALILSAALGYLFWRQNNMEFANIIRCL